MTTHKSDNSCANYLGHFNVLLTYIFTKMFVAHDMTELNSTLVVRMREWERRRISHEANKDNRRCYANEV